MRRKNFDHEAHILSNITKERLQKAVEEETRNVPISDPAVKLLLQHVLGPRPNMCFARGGKGLSSGTLVIRTQTLTLTRDWWLGIAD